ncbi:MAG TPA: hypothetical protein VNT30_13945 [Stellaceae bacterium]|nr:hypothetical protein [Stellaceae bacterium]
MTVKMSVVITDSDLNAYLDGELDPVQAVAVAASAWNSPTASAKLRAYRHQATGLQALFTNILDEPVPARLTRITRSHDRAKHTVVK